MTTSDREEEFEGKRERGAVDCSLLLVNEKFRGERKRHTHTTLFVINLGTLHIYMKLNTILYHNALSLYMTNRSCC